MKRSGLLSLYWICQLSGWSIASFYWVYIAIINPKFNWFQGIADFILDVVIGIGLTHCYRLFALKKELARLKLGQLLLRAIIGVLVLAILYLLLVMGKLYWIRIWLNPDFHISFREYFTNGWLTIFITGTRLMSIWVLGYHLYQYSQSQIRMARENARLSVIAKEAQLSNLSAQLNPHFFFNALNNIKFLVEDSPGSARRAIDLLSDLLRHSLSNSNELLIHLQDEMGLVKDYLELEKLRFEERLQIEITMDQLQSRVLIPPLSIQALVENGIKHGIDKRKEGGHIHVEIASCDNTLVINVENSGRLNGNLSKGVGLANLKERLQLQFPDRSEFRLEQLTPDTVSATIKINLNG
jgi:sensor histidine kinase YesM